MLMHLDYFSCYIVLHCLNISTELIHAPERQMGGFCLSVIIKRALLNSVECLLVYMFKGTDRILGFIVCVSSTLLKIDRVLAKKFIMEQYHICVCACVCVSHLLCQGLKQRK